MQRVGAARKQSAVAPVFILLWRAMAVHNKVDLLGDPLLSLLSFRCYLSRSA
jgi:hypothetical protein